MQVEGRPEIFLACSVSFEPWLVEQVANTAMNKTFLATKTGAIGRCAMAATSGVGSMVVVFVFRAVGTATCVSTHGSDGPQGP